MSSSRSRRRRRPAWYLAAALPLLMAGTLQNAATPQAAAGDDTAVGIPGAPDPGPPVAVHATKVKPRGSTAASRSKAPAPASIWPQKGTSTVTVLSPGTSAALADSQPTDFPITLTALPDNKAEAKKTSAASRRAEVRVLDQTRAEQAGVEGLLFTVAGTEQDKKTADGPMGPVSMSVDYSSFSEAYGGAWASRLRLVELPACAVTTPGKASCREETPLLTENDAERRTLTTKQARVSAGATTVFAVTAEPSSEDGDYKATSLSSSATWATNLNTGAFSWSYDMPVSDAPGGLSPEVTLSYSSGSIDGRTGSTNNQSSWVGDGFDLWPGYIERRYKPCADDGVTNADGNKPGDLCWGYDNATISLNGRADELVPTGDGEWRLKHDDGTRITRGSSSARSNGDNDNEYWRVITPDGMRYYFGFHRLNGWSSEKETTDSAWTVPVYGNDANDPCHGAVFAESWCQQAWRWNLDYVVDPHGYAMAYYYTKEPNAYGRNLEASDDTAYVRGGYLDRIEYGLPYTDFYTDKALAKVDFTSSERCIPASGVTCAAETIEEQPEQWRDTPWDLNCTAGTECDQGRLSPTFWTRKRLTRIDAQVLKDDSYITADSWEFAHRWGEADIDRQLLLDWVQHTGKAATPAITLPEVTFGYTQLANRLDRIGDGKAPFIKARLSTVDDEFGGQVAVEYSDPVCDWDTLPTPESNTTRCFPQFLGSSSSDTQQWFNKYVVTQTEETDRTGAAESEVTKYQYLGGAAWHYDDDDGLTKEKFKTWSTWRGYGHVRVLTGGLSQGMKSQKDSYFLRGMDGDRAGPDDATKSVSVILGAGEGDPIVDHSSTAGFTYRVETYSEPGGKILSKTVDRPWHHQTASRTRPWGTVSANYTGTSDTRTFVSLDDGAGNEWRTTSAITTYDQDTGQPTVVDDRGDDAVGADNQCTRTTYADPGSLNFRTAVARVETVAVSCAATPDRTKDVISDVRTAYDGGGYGQAPTKGNITAVATLKDHTGSQATYMESGRAHDAYGRELTVTDLAADVVFNTAGTLLSRTTRDDGRTTTTAYSPGTGFATKVTVTGPPADASDPATALTTTTTLEPLRGLPVTRIDANNLRSDTTYDALGRTREIWLPDRLKGYYHPNYEFTYIIAEKRQVAVGTTTLGPNETRLTSYTLYDGFLRPRQTQAPGPDGGRLITDTFYDDRGLATKTFAPYYALGTPSNVLQTVDDAREVESQTWTTYDGLGRVTESKEVLGNGNDTVTWATTRTTYHGDRTTVIPPEGATATTTLVDAVGQTTELRQHHTRSAEATFDSTRYTYTPSGEMATLTDPAGNDWEWTYDQLGRATTTVDPDRGTTYSTYDDRGQLTSTTDARDNTLVYSYDNLGRKTAIRTSSTTGELRAEWTYDTVSPRGKGQLATSTRYDNGHAYTTRVHTYDPLYRPTRVFTTIPEVEGEEALAGDYEFTNSYNSGGSLKASGLSPTGSLPGGGVVYSYDELVRPVAVSGLSGAKATVTSYSHTGKVLQAQLTATTSGQFAQITNTYQRGTQRLGSTRVDRYGVSGVDKDATYTYDAAGNVVSVSNASRVGIDNQCFTYDHLRRTVAEWTQTTASCAVSPSASVIGGPAPYWNSYTYDKVGNRLTETRHDLTGDTGQDTVRSYAYPASGGAQPHTLSSMTTQGPTGTAREVFTYLPTGETDTRTTGGDVATYTWDPEGHLAAATTPTGDDGGGEPGDGATTASYVYDADGNRLLARSEAATTLYLNYAEITLTKGSTTPKATRYWDFGVGAQAVQSDDGSIDFVIADHHGTGQLAITATDGLPMRQRRTEPFGALRGQAPTDWPGSRGFIGGSTDPGTGLTHLGARDYDPILGRFTSPDPILEPNRSQTLNGYTYANNNPTTYSDPTGTRFPECSGGGWVCNNGTDPVTKASNYHQVVKRDRITSAGLRYSSQRKPRPLPASDIRPHGTKKPNFADGITWWKVNTLILGGLAQKGYDHAYSLLGHYMQNTGRDYAVDPNEMLEDLPSFRRTLENEVKERKGRKSFDTGWQPTRAEESESLDWYYALNGFEYRIVGRKFVDQKGKAVTVGNLFVYKRYNWGNGSESETRSDLHYGPLELKQYDMAHLHVVGKAREYDVVGSTAFIAEW